MRFTTLFTALFICLPLLTGCKQDNPFGTVYVEGTVTLDGTPIQGVSVTFNPRDGDLVAGGMTDVGGKFRVQTGGAPIGSGAKPGVYDVTFHKAVIEGADLSMEESIAKYGGQQPPVVYIIPQKYENPKTSELEPITVDADRKKNSFTFDLKSE